jgi:hypothetical protein
MVFLYSKKNLQIYHAMNRKKTPNYILFVTKNRMKLIYGAISEM